MSVSEHDEKPRAASGQAEPAIRRRARRADDPAIGEVEPRLLAERLPQVVEHRPPANGPGAVADVDTMVRQMLRAVQVHHIGSTTRLQMDLSPRGLCRLRLELSFDRGRLAARFVVGDSTGLKTLERVAPELEAALASRGVQLEALEFELGGLADGPRRDRTAGREMLEDHDDSGHQDLSDRPASGRSNAVSASSGLPDRSRDRLTRTAQPRARP